MKIITKPLITITVAILLGILCTIHISPARAEETEPDNETITEPIEEPVNENEIIIPSINGYAQNIGSGARNMKEQTITRAIPSKLEETVTELFGEYEPIVHRTYGIRTDYIQIREPDGSYTLKTIEYNVAEIHTSTNWTWFVGVGLFAMILYSFFRCIGAILKIR